MKNLTSAEFNDRIVAVARARRIFIDSGVANKNITTAFILYQDVLAETERQLTLASSIAGVRNPRIMDRYERPKCPECGAEMFFRTLAVNEEGFKTQLLCSVESCDTVLSSTLTIEDWTKELKELENGSRQVKKIE